MNKKIIFSILHKIGTTKILRTLKSAELTILSLHRISPERDFFFNPITPFHFESLLRYVSKYYCVISFNELDNILQEKKTSKKPLLILSFDDGYYDFIEFALPLLKKYQLPSNHNIVNSCASENKTIWTQRLNHIFNFAKENKIDFEFTFHDKTFALNNFENNWLSFYISTFKKMLELQMDERIFMIKKQEETLNIQAEYRMMNWEEIIECSQNNVEIGCHTFNHDVLSSITNLSILSKEIVDSKIEIEKKIEKKISILALPNGQTNENIERICNKVGIDKILFVDDKLNSIKSMNTNKIKSFHRISMVDESDWEMELRTEMLHSKLRNYVGV